MLSYLSARVLFIAIAVSGPLPAAAPAEVGLSSSRLAELDKAMQNFVDRGRLAGVLTGVARDGKLAHVGAHGMRDIEADKPMRRDTIFRIYSMSKPITTAALMTLYEEEKFDLDDPVSKYIPAFADLKVYDGKEGETIKTSPLARPITIRDLMRHTAGLGYGLRPTDPVEIMYREANLLDRSSTLDTMIDKLVKLPLIAQPGTKWVYSIGVDVQGKLIEKLSGTSLDAFFSKRIFEPLAMSDTGFFVPAAKLDRFATNYGPKQGGGLAVVDAAAKSPFLQSPAFFSGGGGLVSTLDDYLRFAQMMLNGGELDGKRILKPETVAMMTKNQLDPKLVPISLGFLPLPRTGFGLGVAVKVSASPAESQGSIGEYMWAGAASTQFFVAPRERLIGVIMTQYLPIIPNHMMEFRQRVYESLESPVAAK